MGLHPKVLGGLQGIDPEVFPPGLLIARLMQLSMVTAAERHGEFITDFKAHRSRLGKAQMMRVTWLTPADQTRLAGHELQMRLVAQPFGFAEVSSLLSIKPGRVSAAAGANGGAASGFCPALPRLVPVSSPIGTC